MRDRDRAFFEPRFGRSFAGVRIHDGPSADAAAKAIGARAFTVGDDIAFAKGAYAPATPDGRRLIAHELAHTLQQRRLGLQLQREVGAGPVDAAPSAAPAPAEPADAGATDAGEAQAVQAQPQRICGPDITSALTTMLGTVGPWFRSLSTFQKRRSCMGLGPGAPLVLVNPIMAWDTRELYLPNTGWLDAYYHSASCGSPRDPGCDTDPRRHLCETAGGCGNSVVVGGKCMLAGTANYALFGTMCRLCHDETGQWGRWDMRAIITAWKFVGDDPTPPREVASAAYDGTFPTMPAAAENRRSCTGRCDQTHGGAFDFIWEPYKPR